VRYIMFVPTIRPLFAVKRVQFRYLVGTNAIGGDGAIKISADFEVHSGLFIGEGYRSARAGVQEEQLRQERRQHNAAIMHLSRRSGAQTRRASPCKSPAMPNGRCRMHGGPSPGAPRGNKNALKHGLYTADSSARRRQIAELLRSARQLIE
jgi:hypothetical protein